MTCPPHLFLRLFHIGGGFPTCEVHAEGDVVQGRPFQNPVDVLDA